MTPFRTTILKVTRSTSAGPALLLAALTMLTAMCVVSSLHGCRRDVSNVHLGEVGAQTTHNAASLELVPIRESSSRSKAEARHGSSQTRDDGVTNPAEVDAALRDDLEVMCEVDADVIAGPPTPPIPVRRTITMRVSPSAELSINDSAIGTAIEKRRLVGSGDSFHANGESVWAWVSVKNAGPDTSHVWMIWKHEGHVRSRVKLNIGKSPRWRTWSRYRMDKRHVGSWTVETTAADGTQLETQAFEVVPAANATTAQSDVPFFD